MKTVFQKLDKKIKDMKIGGISVFVKDSNCDKTVVAKEALMHLKSIQKAMIEDKHAL